MVVFEGWINLVSFFFITGGVIVAILVGASIVASLANLGFDIYLHIKGCCGVYPSACRYRDEFERLKKGLTAKSRNVDKIWTSGKYASVKSRMSN